MRKTLSIVLSIVMVLSLAIIGVSAEGEPTVITTAAEFANMAADGNYKLGADITIDASYGAGETAVPFTGTFDGDGHTVTVSVPMFVVLSGTVKNLTINGEITSTSTSTPMGAVASTGKTFVAVENVTNNANFNVCYRAGGMIGQINNGAAATFTKCVNNGNISHTGDTSAMCGGILGYIQGNTLTVTDCVNNGSITINKGNCGGIISRAGGDYDKTSTYIMTVKNCLNTGNIVNSSGEAAGITGYVRSATYTAESCTNKGNIKGTSDTSGIMGGSNVTKVSGVSNCGNSNITIISCVNEGNIESTNGRGSGMLSYTWAGTGASISSHIEVIGCINKGAIKGKAFVSQIAAYSNSTANVVKDNVGLGSVSGVDADTKLAFFGFSSADVPAGVTGNKIVADGSVYYTYTATAGKEANIITIANLTPDMGVAVVSEADAKAAATALGEIGYIAPKQDPEQPPVTGDNLVVVAVVAVVAVLGMGVAIKAKKD